MKNRVLFWLFALFVFTSIIILDNVNPFIHYDGYTDCCSSMNPTFKDGDHFLTAPEFYDTEPINYGDIVTLKAGAGYLLKRVVGLPGDKIQILNGALIVNDERIEQIQTSEDNIFIEKSNAKISYKIKNSEAEISSENTSPVKLKSNEYYILGDNRGNSHDSRAIGPVKRSQILERVFIYSEVWEKLYYYKIKKTFSLISQNLTMMKRAIMSQ